jgi:hypothetical protein
MELMKDALDIFFKNPLTRLKESQRKTVRVWGLLSFRAFTTSKTSLSSKALSNQVAS